MNFSYEKYSLLLEALLETRVPVIYPKMKTVDGPTFIMRHDIDYGMEYLGEIPRIEADLGVQATYFIQTGSMFYNPFSPSQIRQIDNIKKLGHRIGLHTESSSNVSSSGINDYIEKEMDLLTSQFGDIDAVSFHQPPSYIVNNEVKIKYINTYDAADMEGFTYMSDSAGKWSKGNPLELLSSNPSLSFQVLTHPVVWGEKHVEFKVRAVNSVIEKANTMYDYLSNHCKMIPMRRGDIHAF